MQGDMMKPGNVGIVTTIDETLCEVTGIFNGLVYCYPLTGHRVVRVCLPDQFWVLLDAMP
jgi:hypothetical protein